VASGAISPDTAIAGGYFGLNVWNGTGTIRNATVS
jgi:hypothetical protein